MAKRNAKKLVSADHPKQSFGTTWLIAAFTFGMILAYVLPLLGFFPSTIDLGIFSFEVPLARRADLNILEQRNAELLWRVDELTGEVNYLSLLLNPFGGAGSPAGVGAEGTWEPDYSLLHGQSIFRESFENNRNEWNLTSQATDLVVWEKEILNNALRMDLNFVEDAAGSTPVPIEETKNFVLSFDATILDSAINEPTYVQVNFRRQIDGSYYNIRFGNNSAFEFRRCQPDVVLGCAWVEIIDLTQADFIYGENGTKNAYAIVALGSTFSFYANGNRLATVQDTVISEPGDVSLGVWGTGETTALVSFENLRISDTSSVEAGVP